MTLHLFPSPSPDPSMSDRPQLRQRPVFQGCRFVVHAWQIALLARLLGPHAETFDLHAWFFELDARVTDSPELIPQFDGGRWLVARTVEEAEHRGLFVAAAEPVRRIGEPDDTFVRGVVENLRRQGVWPD